MYAFDNFLLFPGLRKQKWMKMTRTLLPGYEDFLSWNTPNRHHRLRFMDTAHRKIAERKFTARNNGNNEAKMNGCFMKTIQ